MRRFGIFEVRSVVYYTWYIIIRIISIDAVDKSPSHLPGTPQAYARVRHTAAIDVVVAGVMGTRHVSEVWGELLLLVASSVFPDHDAAWHDAMPSAHCTGMHACVPTAARKKINNDIPISNTTRKFGNSKPTRKICNTGPAYEVGAAGSPAPRVPQSGVRRKGLPSWSGIASEMFLRAL